jgi:hypothetical protein
MGDMMQDVQLSAIRRFVLVYSTYQPLYTSMASLFPADCEKIQTTCLEERFGDSTWWLGSGGKNVLLVDDQLPILLSGQTSEGRQALATLSRIVQVVTHHGNVILVLILQHLGDQSRAGSQLRSLLRSVQTITMMSTLDPASLRFISTSMLPYQSRRLIGIIEKMNSGLGLYLMLCNYPGLDRSARLRFGGTKTAPVMTLFSL